MELPKTKRSQRRARKNQRARQFHDKVETRRQAKDAESKAEERAEINYDSFHQFPMGSCTIEQVQNSSAGLGGRSRSQLTDSDRFSRPSDFDNIKAPKELAEVVTGNRLEPLATMAINNIDGQGMTRPAQIAFREADVRKTLASASCVAKALNGICSEANGGYIQNLKTGGRMMAMMVRVINDVYVFDVELDDNSQNIITLDSVSGCSIWPKGRHAGQSKMTEQTKGVGMVAANGTPIKHYGRGRACLLGIQATSVFSERTFIATAAMRAMS